MYQPEAFIEQDPAALAALMADYPLATLLRTGPDGALDADHLPLLWQADAQGPGGVLRGHVARANPLWQQATGRSVLAVFQGPQAYVTPSWYETKARTGKVVPTWNYAVVHAHGTLRAIDDPAWLLDFVSTLTRQHEAGRPRPWAVSDAPEDYIASMLGAIVGIELRVSRLEGKWKMSQNRLAVDREGVAQGLMADQGRDAATWMAERVAPRQG